MKRRILFNLEYGCWPLWWYDEDGFLIDNCSPPDWEDDQELNDALRAVMVANAAGYVDENGEEDFNQVHRTEEEDRAFRAMVAKAMELVDRKNNGKYNIEYHVYV